MRTSGRIRTGQHLRLELAITHTMEQRWGLKRTYLRQMMTLILLAAFAAAAQGQLDSTLGDVLGAIASVFNTLLILSNMM